MSRKRIAQERAQIGDPKYDSLAVSQMVKRIMRDGKKSIAEKIVYKALEFAIELVSKDKEKLTGIKQNSDKPLAVNLLEEALGNVKPAVEVRPRRVGGATYQVPMEVPEKRGKTLAVRWVVNAARQRKDKGMFRRLAHELVDASYQRGIAIKKREEMHRMAKANQAFAHFRVSSN
jgi:small subunit ribosomal protein S7